MIGGRLPARKAGGGLAAPSSVVDVRVQAGLLDDAEALADLVEAWLYEQGLKAVPIGRGDGEADVAGISRGTLGVGPGRSGERSSFTVWVDALRLARGSGEANTEIRVGSLVIDVARRTVHVDEIQVHLTPTEFRLLRYLAEHPDRIVGHRELLATVWGPGYEDDIHLLQVTIRDLRARIALATDNPLIETVYGAGYRMA